MRFLAPNRENGFILPIFLITTVLIAIIIVTIMSTATLDYRLSTREYHKVNAQMAADAGLDRALVELTGDSDWTGSGSEVTLLNNENVKTTYQTTVVNGASSNRKILSVIAKTYSPKISPDPQIIRRYEIDVEAVTTGGSGPSSVVSGVGGLSLTNNSKISGGDVLVNGKITLTNQAQIGLQSNPVNVRVAHQSCPSPADATFPRVCNSGENGQPITLNNNAKIYGDVRATNQTNGNGMSNPGLVPNQTVEAQAMPTYDRNAHKAAVTTTWTPSQASCPNNGSKTWPANLKITGNIQITNNCTLTIEGNVWITGNLSLSNQTRVIIPNSLGTNRPAIMIDGSGGFNITNNSRILPNSSGVGLHILTFWSNASCSPDCADVTGPALASSQNVRTIDLSNQGSAEGTIFYARWSKVTISNNGSIGAVAGQTVELGNQAVISFTASVPGSDNLIQTWVKRGYMRTYN